MVPNVRGDHLERPHATRLAVTHPRFDEIVDCHRVAQSSGSPTYRDPATGFSVFTAAFLADRGYCCSSGCRHCPYVGAPD
jgi:hypothetical protein